MGREKHISHRYNKRKEEDAVKRMRFAGERGRGAHLSGGGEVHGIGEYTRRAVR